MDTQFLIAFWPGALNTYADSLPDEFYFPDDLSSLFLSFDFDQFLGKLSFSPITEGFL
jgi:hypothetical protein